MKRPSLGALLLGLIPFIGVCFSVSAWDRIDPIVFGLPFNLFWVLLWAALTPICLWLAYKVEASRSSTRSATVDRERPR